MKLNGVFAFLLCISLLALCNSFCSKNPTNSAPENQGYKTATELAEALLAYAKTGLLDSALKNCFISESEYGQFITQDTVACFYQFVRDYGKRLYLVADSAFTMNSEGGLVLDSVDYWTKENAVTDSTSKYHQKGNWVYVSDSIGRYELTEGVVRSVLNFQSDLVRSFYSAFQELSVNVANSNAAFSEFRGDSVASQFSHTNKFIKVNNSFCGILEPKIFVTRDNVLVGPLEVADLLVKTKTGWKVLLPSNFSLTKFSSEDTIPASQAPEVIAAPRLISKSLSIEGLWQTEFKSIGQKVLAEFQLNDNDSFAYYSGQVLSKGVFKIGNPYTVHYDDPLVIGRFLYQNAAKDSFWSNGSNDTIRLSQLQGTNPTIQPYLSKPDTISISVWTNTLTLYQVHNGILDSSYYKISIQGREGFSSEDQLYFVPIIESAITNVRPMFRRVTNSSDHLWNNILHGP